MAVDYYELIDRIAESESAFAYFKAKASKYAEFYFLNQDEIRPCDMKEKLAEMNKNRGFDLVYYFKDYPTLFLKLNQYLLEKKIICEEKSKGYAYRRHALRIMEKSADDLTLYDMEDVMFIMINVMREPWKERVERVEELDNFVLRDMELRISKGDSGVIGLLSFFALSTKFEYEKKEKHDLLSSLSSIVPIQKLQIYGMYGMVLLTHMLMERGEFEEGCDSHG